MAENKENALQGMSVDRGSWAYDDAAETGHIEIEVPAAPGSPNAVERLHARDFGPHVAAKIENFMNQPGYLSAPGQNAPAIFRHYVGVAAGASLVDDGGLRHMKTMAKQFEAKPDRREYFEQVVRPFLHSLTPTRRQP